MSKSNQFTRREKFRILYKHINTYTRIDIDSWLCITPREITRPNKMYAIKIQIAIACNVFSFHITTIFWFVFTLKCLIQWIPCDFVGIVFYSCTDHTVNIFQTICDLYPWKKKKQKLYSVIEKPEKMDAIKSRQQKRVVNVWAKQKRKVFPIQSNFSLTFFYLSFDQKKSFSNLFLYLKNSIYKDDLNLCILQIYFLFTT